MSQKNWTPFDTILGCYGFPATVRHHRLEKKTYLFMHDRWHEVGEITFNFVQVSGGLGYIEAVLPDFEKYAADHESEGALDWLNWGPRVN